MGIFHRIVKQPRSNQSGRMRHVNHKDGTHLIGNFAHAFVVPFTAVGRTAADDHLRLVFKRQALHFIIVHTSRLTVQIVTNGVIQDARRVHTRTVRKMTTMIKIKPHKSVARFQHGQEHGSIGLRSRMRLHIGILCIEEFLDAFNGERFNLVDNAATAIIAFTRITLGIFIGQPRPHGTHHFVADKVFRRNEFNTAQLALVLLLNERKDFCFLFHGSSIYVVNM